MYLSTVMLVSDRWLFEDATMPEGIPLQVRFLVEEVQAVSRGSGGQTRQRHDFPRSSLDSRGLLRVRSWRCE